MHMMDKILVNKESLERIQTKLRGIKVSVEDKNIQSVIWEILEILDDEINAKVISVEQMIQDKMNETKISNPELNFKLYMLQRKLVDGKIHEDDALEAYELYIRM